MTKTDLIIIGGGAAGLMAGCVAGEAGLKTLVLERKHKPGRKLLMCGNARCNLTTNISTPRMIEMFGEPVGPFLTPALEAFGPAQLQRWFGGHGLRTVTKTGNKVYPHTERASDVLNFFTDYLRDKNVSLAVSSPVKSIEKVRGGFRVQTENYTVEAQFVLLATGGVSYPKTGSVGDGQQWAEKLGHSLEPYRPGLAGFEVEPKVIQKRVGQIYEKVTCQILSGGNVMGETRGVFEIEKWGVGGTALTDAGRIISRLNLKQYSLRVEMVDGRTEEIRPLRMRPLKEAMVTVGGVSLKEVKPETLESRKCPGLYLVGEVLDVDGPTGGYNLQAAFSTARLAVSDIATRCGKKIGEIPSAAPKKRGRHRPPHKSGNPRHRSKRGGSGW